MLYEHFDTATAFVIPYILIFILLASAFLSLIMAEKLNMEKADAKKYHFFMRLIAAGQLVITILYFLGLSAIAYSLGGELYG